VVGEEFGQLVPIPTRKLFQDGFGLFLFYRSEQVGGVIALKIFDDNRRILSGKRAYQAGTVSVVELGDHPGGGIGLQQIEKLPLKVGGELLDKYGNIGWVAAFELLLQSGLIADFDQLEPAVGVQGWRI